MKKKLQVEYFSINELQPYEKNPRTHSASQINQVAKSIKKFGFNNPILVDSEKGIIAGHCRLEASKKLKIKQKVNSEILRNRTAKI